MVEPTSPTAGVGIRRDYALNQRLSVGIDLELAQVGSTEIVATIVAFMDAPP